MDLRRRVLANLTKGGKNMRVLWANSNNDQLTIKGNILPSGTEINQGGTYINKLIFSPAIPITTGQIYFEGWAGIGAANNATSQFNTTINYGDYSKLIRRLGSICSYIHKPNEYLTLNSEIIIEGEELVLRTIATADRYWFSSTYVYGTASISGTIYEVNI